MLCASCKHSLPPSDALPTPAQTAQLQNLHRSSHFPPDPSYYLAQISSSTPALTQYDVEIGRVQQTLRGIFAERRKIQAYIDGCRSVFAPIRRMPPEVLCEIFLSYSEFPFERSKDEPETREIKQLSKWNMLLISHVCAQWRTLVLGTPKFWSDIVVYGNRWSDNPTQPLHLLRTSLERGARHPLTLFMDLSGLLDSTAHTVLDLAMEHCERWQSLSLIVDRDVAVLNRMNPIRGRLGMLERLEMRFLKGPDSVGGVFETAPRLCHVHFGNLDLLPCPKLPWKQLRSFVYQHPRGQDVGASLALMRNLQPETTFELRGFDPWDLDLPLTLPPLTARVFSFRVTPCTQAPRRAMQALGDILNSLTLPHLYEFSIDRVWDRFSKSAIFWPLDQFESLSLRSSFRDSLRSLELRHIMITEGELLRSLASLASLERLVISDQYDIFLLVTDALLRGLTITPNPLELCLQALSPD